MTDDERKAIETAAVERFKQQLTSLAGTPGPVPTNDAYDAILSRYALRASAFAEQHRKRTPLELAVGAYVEGLIEVDELERRIEKALSV